MPGYATERLRSMVTMRSKTYQLFQEMWIGLRKYEIDKLFLKMYSRCSNNRSHSVTYNFFSFPVDVNKFAQYTG